MKYIKIKQGLRDKGTLVPVDQVTDFIYRAPDIDIYESIFFYNEEHKSQFDKTGSTAGIKDVVTNKMFWDFDSKDNVELAQNDTKELVSRLKSSGFKENEIQVYFSGQKGFTVMIEQTKDLFPNEVRSICVENFGKNLDTLDLQIYDHARVLRSPFSKHNVTGLRKIPLNHGMLENATIDDIKSAASQHDIETIEYDVSKRDVTEFVIKKEKKKEKPNAALNPNNNPINQIDWSLKPKDWLDYKWALIQGFFEPGERHNALLVIAATCRSIGYDDEQAYYLCKSALKKQSKRLGVEEFDKSELWLNIIKDSVFSSKWNGGSYSVKNNIWLQSYCQKMGFNPENKEEDKEKTFSVLEAYPSFKEYASNIDKLTVKFGVPELDKKVKLTVGMSAGIVAGPGVGKSSIIIQCLNHMSKYGEQCIFFSFDMFGPIVIQKLIQKHTRLTDEEIFLKINGTKTLYKDDPESLYLKKQNRRIISESELMYTFDFSEKKEEGFEDRLLKILQEEYSNVEFCFNSGMDIESIVRTIKSVEEKTGKKVKLICVDYNELVTTDLSDATASSGYVAQKMREIALLYGVCALQLFQPNKASGGPEQDIKSYLASKGSGAISQSLSVMLGMSRPGYNPNDPDRDIFARIRILKNRMGPLSTIDLHFEGSSGTFRSLTDDERNVLKQLESEKEAALIKSSSENSGW